MDKEKLKIEISDVLYNQIKKVLENNNNNNIFKILDDCFKANEAGKNLNEFDKNEVVKNVMMKLFSDSTSKE